MAFQDGASLQGQLEIVLKDKSGKVKEVGIMRDTQTCDG